MQGGQEADTFLRVLQQVAEETGALVPAPGTAPDGADACADGSRAI